MQSPLFPAAIAIDNVFTNFYLFVLLGCRLLGISLEELSIASVANVGGSTVSAPMAATFDLKRAITPAILLGVLGNVLGTFIGVFLGLLLQ